MRIGYKKLAAIFVLSGLAACAPKPAPIKPPPITKPAPPPAIPPVPYPPGGASPTMSLPGFGIDGVRQTPNRMLSPDESIWHLRSALNVAAINCRGLMWAQITPDYNQFLTVHKTQLARATKAIDTDYKKRYGGVAGLRVRDTKSTELYNYFALPPVKQEFCDTSMRKVHELLLVPTAAFPEYAVGAIKEIDGIYIRFFDAYATYQRDLADWNQRYGPRPVMTTAPAPVTIAPKPAGT
jgi:hypothetical protein